MHHIMLSAGACLAVPYLSILSHKWHSFHWRVTERTLPYFSILSHKWHSLHWIVTEHKMFVLIFSTTFVQNTSHSKKNWVRYYHTCTYVFTYSTCYLSDFNQMWTLTDILKIFNISWQSVQWELNCLMLTAKQMDKTKTTAAHRNFGNEPKEIASFIHRK